MVPTHRVWNETKGWQNMGYITGILSSMNGWWCKYYCFSFFSITWRHHHIRSCADGFTWHRYSVRTGESHLESCEVSSSQLLTQKYIIPPNLGWSCPDQGSAAQVQWHRSSLSFWGPVSLLSMILNKLRWNVSWDIQIPLIQGIYSRNET